MALPQPTLLPPVHRGMTVLDREAFRTKVPLLAARLPASKTTGFLKEDGKDIILRLRGVASVAPDSSEQHRQVLLRTRDKSQLSQKALDILAKNDAELVEASIEVDYDYWTSDQVLQAILPEDLLDESPTAFTQCGHIAHLNLRDQYLPHKHIIGQVILDKNKSLRTVVNKLDTIHLVYRNFEMEVLAGEPDFQVEMSEHDCKFRFDFSAVYWNSRLQTEHARLVSTFSPHDVIVDGFAGVGPFAIPSGKKGCGVLASDLNPKSAEALEGNAKLNKVERTVRTSNEDGRDFIRRSVLSIWNDPFPAYVAPISSRERSKRAREANKAKAAAKEKAMEVEAAPGPVTDVVQQLAATTLATSSTSTPPAPSSEPSQEKLRRLPSHYIMNLPASALEFLDAFQHLFAPLYAHVAGGEEAVLKVVKEEVGGLPVVHCYCFTKEEGEEAVRDICERATSYLGHSVTPQLDRFACHYVRDVAPKKAMYCLEFRLTEEMVR